MEVEFHPEAAIRLVRAFPQHYQIHGQIGVRILYAQGFAPDDPSLSLNAMVSEPSDPPVALTITSQGLILQWEDHTQRETLWQMLHWDGIQAIKGGVASPASSLVTESSTILRISLINQGHLDLSIAPEAAHALAAMAEELSGGDAEAAQAP